MVGIKEKSGQYSLVSIIVWTDLSSQRDDGLSTDLGRSMGRPERKDGENLLTLLFLSIDGMINL